MVYYLNYWLLIDGIQCARTAGPWCARGNAEAAQRQVGGVIVEGCVKSIWLGRLGDFRAKRAGRLVRR